MGFYRVRFKYIFRSTHKVQQLLFTIFPSILTFNFDFILGSLWIFWRPYGLCFGPGQLWKTSFVLCFLQIYYFRTHVVEQLLFSIVPSILIFHFDLISPIRPSTHPSVRVLSRPEMTLTSKAKLLFSNFRP